LSAQTATITGPTKSPIAQPEKQGNQNHKTKNEKERINFA